MNEFGQAVNVTETNSPERYWRGREDDAERSTKKENLKIFCEKGHKCLGRVVIKVSRGGKVVVSSSSGGGDGGGERQVGR